MSIVDFGMYSPTRIYFYSFFLFFSFGLGFDPFNNGFYRKKFYFPFNTPCKYLDFMFVSEDK